jgi:hypothetical protein
MSGNRPSDARRVHALAITCCAFVGAFGAMAAACSSSSSGSAQDGGVDQVTNDAAADASSGEAESEAGDAYADADGASTSSDGPSLDAATDAGEAGSLTESLGSTGWAVVYPNAVTANFYLNDDIVRVSDAPECVIRFRNQATVDSCVGNLIMGGDYFGVDGGPPEGVLKIPCDVTSGNYYGASPTAADGGPASWVYYPETADLHVQLSTDGTGTGIPDLPVTTLRTPAFSQINFTAPSEPDGGACNVGGFSIPHDQPFQVRWDVPDAGASDQRVAVQMYQFATSSSVIYDTAEIWCGYPLSAGQATVPVSALTKVWNRLGGAGDAGGTITFTLGVTVGDQKEVQVNGASFVINVQNSTAMLFSSDCAPIGQIPVTMQ